MAAYQWLNLALKLSQILSIDNWRCILEKSEFCDIYFYTYLEVRVRDLKTLLDIFELAQKLWFRSKCDGNYLLDKDSIGDTC